MIAKMSRAKDYRLPESRCPNCDYKLDGATVAHGEDVAPQTGDASACLNCGQLLIYTDGTLLRQATAGEIRDLMQQRESWAMIEKMQAVIAERGRFA